MAEKTLLLNKSILSSGLLYAFGLIRLCVYSLWKSIYDKLELYNAILASASDHFWGWFYKTAARRTQVPSLDWVQ